MSLVKNLIECISEPVIHICNLSLKHGVFPHTRKIAKAIPLFKSGEKHLSTNDRPISLLPQFTKMLEKRFNSQHECFVNFCDILNSCQYEFIEGMSTSHNTKEQIYSQRQKS